MTPSGGDHSPAGIVGGVFPLEDVSAPPSPSSLLSTWTADAVATHLFHNARSSIRHSVAVSSPRRVWLPAYLCPSIDQAVRNVAREVRFYAVDGHLNLDPRFLGESVRPGDAVLTINYFGRPASPALRAALADAEDVLWIEDCAQTLDIGGEHYGDVRIYSPRKIVGAPDGGVLVVRHAALQAPCLDAASDDSFMRPYLLRAADVDGGRRKEWYAAFQSAEAAMTPCNWSMSDASKNILERIDAESIFARRSANYAYLLQEMGDLALFPSPPCDWVPFGFPLLTKRHEVLWRHLRRHQVYAPRHWRNLTSPRDTFPEAHALSKALMTIPCDQRYGPREMARVVQLIREVCP